MDAGNEVIGERELECGKLPEPGEQRRDDLDPDKRASA